MDPFDEALATRLRRMESAVPVRTSGPWTTSIRSTTLRPSRRAGLALGIAMAAAALTGGIVGAAVSGAVNGSPGVFSTGGPLYCSNIQSMSPADAAPLLSQLGYSVIWQIEDKTRHSSTVTELPPKEGYIIDGGLHGRGLLLVVESGQGAEPATRSCS
jgi:hypothetical protein